MARTKKGADTAPKTSTASIPDSEQTVNAEIVAEMLAYDPRDWLSDADRLIYDAAAERLAEIEADRKRATEGMDRASDEYDETWNNTRRVEHHEAFFKCKDLEAIACDAYVARYALYTEEAAEAFRQSMRTLIIELRAILADRLAPYGLTLDDAQQIDRANEAAGIAYTNPDIEWMRRQPMTSTSWTVLDTFSDGTLRNEAENMPIFRAWRAGCLVTMPPETAKQRTEAVLSEILPQKWTLTAPPTVGDKPAEPQRCKRIHPEHTTLITHKMLPALRDCTGIIDREMSQSVRVGRRGTQDVVSFLTVRFNEPADGKTPVMFVDGKLTDEQTRIADAVATVLLEELRCGRPLTMTDKEILEAKVGGSKNPTPKQVQEVQENMRALRRLTILYECADEFDLRRVDYTSVMERFGVKDATFDGVLEDTFFANGIRHRTASNGRPEKCYDFWGRPPLPLVVAMATKQLITIDARYAAIPGRTSEQRARITRELIQRITPIAKKLKTTERARRRTRIDTIMRRAHLDATNDNVRRSAIDNIRHVLDYWMQIGCIPDYGAYKDPGSPKDAGYEIGTTGQLMESDLKPRSWELGLSK